MSAELRLTGMEGVEIRRLRYLEHLADRVLCFSLGFAVGAVILAATLVYVVHTPEDVRPIQRCYAQGQQ